MELRTMPLGFRVWDIEEQEMIYEAERAYDFLYPDRNPLAVDNFYELIHNDRYIVSQDTGLPDRCARRIYTGDILEKKYSNDAEFNGVRAVCYYDDGKIDFECVIGDDNVKGFLEEYDIVGNIWQNPEYLEDE